MTQSAGMSKLWLVVLAITPIVAQEWSWRDGWPEGWARRDGWRVADGVLRPDGAGRAVTSPPVALGLHGRVRFTIVTPLDGPGGIVVGLSAGDPALPARRLAQFAAVAGHLCWFDGEAWNELAQVPAGRRVAVDLALDRERGRMAVTITPNGSGTTIPEVPFWNQVGYADTLFVAGPDQQAPEPGGLAAVTVEGYPARPRPPGFDVQRLQGRAVRLRWSPGAQEVSGFRLLRDEVELARFGPGARAFVDDTVAPRTPYAYRLEVLGPGGAATRTLVTGPETEIAAVSGEWDAVVYGATPGGIAAALMLGRAGWSVVLIEPGEFVGGMITGGLGRTDFGSIHALGGLFADYLKAVSAYYLQHSGPDSDDVKAMRDGLYFEPHAARSIFLEWLAEVPEVTLIRGAHLVGVKADGGIVRGVVVEDRDRVVRRVLGAKVFIDAGYEGDLAAAAGAEYRIGRESGAEFGEKYAGKLWWDVWQRRVVLVEGTGDRTVQAYNYRLCVTRQVPDRLPPPQPTHYHRERYLGLLPDLAAGRLKTLKDILSILPLPGLKADANNHPQGNPSSDLIGGADDYPEADWKTRQAIIARHRDHILGLLWFLRFDQAVPEPMRLDAQRWGLAIDEFPEEDGWPSQLYVREARRIVGRAIFTEHDAMAVPGGERPPIRRDSIAVGAYPIDSHATGGRHPEHPDWLEGFFYLARGETKPYQIPYGILVPNGLANVLVCGALSATHVGYGTLRMEPVFMALGTAAGLAAAQAVESGVAPDRVDLLRLQRELLRHDQVLTVFEDVARDTPGRDGFNLFGTLGAFPGYQARPGEPITGPVLEQWLALAAGLFGLTVPPTDDGPLEVNRRLSALAAGLGVAAPRLDAAEPTRGQAMAALWQVVSAAMDRPGPARTADG